MFTVYLIKVFWGVWVESGEWRHLRLCSRLLNVAELPNVRETLLQNCHILL